jgi:hypothetical protein
MPGRLRIVNVFGQRAVPSESVTPKDVYIISVAGEGKTEEQYFDGLKEISVDNTIWIDRLEKADETDTKSHPNYVLELLEEREKYWKEFGVESNELWMVVDRDLQNVNITQLEEIIEKCANKGYNLALSNPTFEFWLLLHITSVENYDPEKLLANSKPSVKSKKRYLETLLSELTGGYNKNKLNFKKIESGITDAITRAKQLPVDNKILMNNLGTSVCILVEKLIV